MSTIALTLTPRQAPIRLDVRSPAQQPAAVRPVAVGPRGQAGTATLELVAGRNLSGHRMVLIRPDGRADYGSAGVLEHGTQVVGITLGATLEGGVAGIQLSGVLQEPSWAWELNKPVFLGLDGVLTQTAPVGPSSKFSLCVGFPISVTSLFVNIGFPIQLA